MADPSSRHVTLYRTAADVSVLAEDEKVDCSSVLDGFAPLASALFG